MTPNEAKQISILLLPRYDRKGASSRLRFLDLISGLKDYNIVVTAAPFFDDEYLDNLYKKTNTSVWRFLFYFLRRAMIFRSLHRYDLVWVEKETFPWLPFTFERLLLRGKPYVVDFDDAWHLRYRTHRLSLIRWLLGSKMEKIVAGSSLAVMGNDYLCDWARQAGAQNILKLPTTLDPKRYRLAVASSTSAVDRPLIVGWVGSPSSMKLLRTIEPILAALTQTGEIELRVVGAVSERLASCPAQYIDWSEESESQIIAGFDVGIMPLEDSEWSRAKCAYKLIQYMAAGLPVIASPIGMNCEVVTPGETGFLPTTEDDWLKAFRCLRRDPALRSEMGRRNRERVQERYSLDFAVRTLAKAMRERLSCLLDEG